jgi:hypothetical protein
MSGGGKGGSNTQATEIPKWLEEPAIRNIARAEDVQRIPYMPWYGPDVAAFNPDQQAAMQSNIGAAEAFGLVPTGSLNAMSGVPSPISEYTGGIQGYSANPLYNQALAELKTNQPGAVDQYDALFGNRVDPKGNVLPSYEEMVRQGNSSAYDGNLGFSYGGQTDDNGVAYQLTDTGDIVVDPSVQYLTIDNVGWENPNHANTGWTGPSGTSSDFSANNYGYGGSQVDSSRNSANFGWSGGTHGDGSSGPDSSGGFGGFDDGTDESDAAAADQGYW